MAGTTRRSAVTTYLPHDEAERLTDLAKRRDVPVAQLVRDAIRTEILEDVAEGEPVVGAAT